METRILSDVALYGSLVMSSDLADFPANPSIGTIIIKNQCLYAYIKIGGLETWYPFASKTDSYIHVQGLASTTWTVHHNLGTTDVWYQIKDANGNLMVAPKTDVDSNTFTINLTTPMAGTCIVVAPQSIDVPEVKASLINIGSGAIIMSSAGITVGTVDITSSNITIGGASVLTSASIAQQIADAIATKDNTDEITEGSVNLYYADYRARGAFSFTDTGGDGSLSFNSVTGEVTYTGPSDSEVRAHFSSGNGIDYSNTTGSIAIDTNVVATVSNLNAEITRASAAESTLTANLLVEKTRALAAESTLTTSLNSEITRATTAESTLTSSLNTEVTRATNAEATLTSSLNNEVTRATAAEATLTSNLLVEKTRALGAESTLTSSLNSEITRALAAEASIAQSVANLGNAINYVGTLVGGATSGAAYDLATLPSNGKNTGDYYKVTTSGYFVISTGTPFYANANDGLVWNAAGGVDIIDNTNTTVAGTASFISVTGSTDTGYTVNIDSAFSGRMTTAENNILVEKTRATNAESTLTSSLNTEITRATNAESTLTSSLNTEITRATNAESTLTSSLNTEVTRATNAENTEITRATAAEASLAASILAEKTRALAAENALTAGVGALGNAFNYVGGVNGGATSGAAYDLSTLASGSKDPGDYYKVTTSGYFKVGATTPFYANLNDGLVWNLSSGVDIIDNTNSAVAGTTSFISVSGSSDTGYTVDVDTAFKTRMTNAESNILVEQTRATNAESTLTSSLNTEITRATNAESTLTANLLVEKTRALAAEATKEPTITAGTTAQYWRGDKSWQTLNSSAVGLGNVTNVAQLANTQTLAITGDVTATSTALNTGTIAATLANTTVTANSYGSATQVGTFTVDSKGRLTAAGNTTVTPAWSSITSTPTTISGYGITDAYTKAQVDSFVQGLDPKASVVAATTANITLSAAQTIDGISVVAGDRVLVKNQTTTSANGIYIVASGSWTRATDMDAWTEIPGAYVFVEKGTTYADTGWVCTSDQGGTLDTTAITWSQFAGAGSVTAGTGISVSGTQVSLANTAVTAAAYGSATQVGTFTVDAQGRLTTATSTSIQITESQVTNLTTDLAAKAPLASPTFTGTVSGITATMVGLGNVTNVAQLPNTQALAITGDVTASSTALNTGTIATTLATVTQSTGSNFVKITIDTKGRVTGNTAVVKADLTGLGVADASSSTYVGTTAVALNRTSANLALTGISSVTLPGATSGSVQVIPTAAAGTGTVLTLPATTGTVVTTGDTGTVTNTMLAGSIANAKLTNSSVTVGSTAIALGASSTTLAGLTSVTSTGFTGALTGNADTATKLATGRTIAITGDATWTSPSFDGSGNVTAALTLANTAVTAAAYGSATQVGTFTVDSKGRLTAATSTSIQIAESQVTNLTTDLAAKAPLASPTFTGTVTVASLATAINNISTSSTTTTSTTATTVSTFATASYRSASFDVQVSSGTSYTTKTIKVIHDGTSVTIQTIGEMVIGSALGTFDASISTGNLNLVFTPASATSTTVKIVQTAIVV